MVQAAEVGGGGDAGSLWQRVPLGGDEARFVGWVGDGTVEAHVRARVVVVSREAVEHAVEVPDTEWPDPVEKLAT